MKVVQTIDSNAASLTIREYSCPKGHIFIGQEELLDEIHKLRDALKGDNDVRKID
jgi:hypothetical protein